MTPSQSAPKPKRRRTIVSVLEDAEGPYTLWLFNNYGTWVFEGMYTRSIDAIKRGRKEKFAQVKNDNGIVIWELKPA